MPLFDLGVVKFWQGVVEMVIRTICIVLVIITFITSIAAVRNLSAEKTEIRFIEDLRFDTRSPVGWILLLTLFAIPLTILLLVLRFVNVEFIDSKRKIILVADSIITGLLALGYFCGAVPLAVHVGDWRFWRGRGSNSDNERYNMDSIVSSSEATAAFSFLSCFSLVALVVWLVLYYVLGWVDHEQKYRLHRAEGAPKVTMITSESEVNIVKTEEFGDEGKDFDMP